MHSFSFAHVAWNWLFVTHTNALYVKLLTLQLQHKTQSKLITTFAIAVGCYCHYLLKPPRCPANSEAIMMLDLAHFDSLISAGQWTQLGFNGTKTQVA